MEWASELYALASRCPYVGNSLNWEDAVGRNIVVAGVTLPLEAAAAQARSLERNLDTTVAELLVELEETASQQG